jgi:branched-subunit amino acid aminotransferase/4-amino-4-deoxychorismate lyase
LANILIEKAGHFYTPPISSGCLPGIIREILLAGDFKISETEFSADDLLISGVALVSSLREIQIVTQVNGVPTRASPKLINLATEFRNLTHATPDF